MTEPVSVVVPALGDRELLDECLPPIMEEVADRDAGDEVVVVDDTGGGRLGEWLAEGYPRLRCVARSENGGFARALTSGVESARSELVFAVNPDVRVRPGFLAPLQRALSSSEVFAAVPRILLGGEEGRIESLTRLVFEEGLLRLEQPGLEPLAGGVSACLERVVPVPFAVGGAFLFRRRLFEELGGFDPLFEPFYLEDLDLCWRAWGRGLSVLHVPESCVEHRHRGTIARVAPPEAVRAAIERNLLLFQWKHLSGRLVREHLLALRRSVHEACLLGRREELTWLALALEQRRGLGRARREGGAVDFERILRASDPLRG